MLAPKWRRQVGVDVILRGQSISAIVGIDDRGRLVLRRANDCEFVGDGSRARLTFNTPAATVTRTIGVEGLIDLKWAEHGSRPWLGVSPLSMCGYSAIGVANVERSMSREVAQSTGLYFAAAGRIRRCERRGAEKDIKGMKGNLAVVQSLETCGALATVLRKSSNR